MKGISAEFIPEFLVFQIKKGETNDESKRQTLQFIDVNKKIFYDDLKA